MKLPFSVSLRSEIDDLIDTVSNVLVKHGQERLPTELYKFYRKSDEEILHDLIRESEDLKADNNEENATDEIDQSHGSRMVVEHYLR